MDLSVNTSSTYATGSSKSALKSCAKKTDNASNTPKAADTAAVYEKTTTEKKDSANKIYNRDAVVAQIKSRPGKPSCFYAEFSRKTSRKTERYF